MAQASLFALGPAGAGTLIPGKLKPNRGGFPLDGFISAER